MEHLTPPEYCDSCCSINIMFINQKYHCPDCNASVGCHPETNNPLGLMASGDVRRLRIIAHDCLDLIWKSGFMSRNKTYIWLANELNIERDLCHIAMFNAEQLTLTINASTRYYSEYFIIMKRRKDKKHAKHERRVERTNKRIRARMSTR